MKKDLRSELKNEHWFKFYYLRILVSCMGWKDDEFGAYVKLLIHQFDKGFVPTDEAELKKLITSYKKNWSLLKSKFPEDEPGKLRNGVMAIVRQDFEDRQSNNKKNGLKGGRPKKQKNETESKPKGFKNKTHIDIYSISNSEFNSEEKDEGLGEEKTELAVDGFFSDTIDKEIELSELQVKGTIEFISIICKTTLLEKDVGEYWKAFKIQQLDKHEWYNGFEDLLSHFRNSLKKLILNGNSQNNGAGRQNNTHRAVITGTADGAGSL